MPFDTLIAQEFDNIKLKNVWLGDETLEFKEGTKLIHKDNCKYTETYIDEDCTCTPKVRPIIVAIIKVAAQKEDLERRYWYVRIEEYPEDFKSKDEYKIPNLYPSFLLESIYNAYSTLYTMLKYYEVTNKVLDWANPPEDMREIIYGN